MALAWPVLAQDEPPPKTPPPAEPETQVEEKAPPPPPVKKSIEDPPLHRWGGWTLSIAAWQPSLVGTDEELALAEQSGIPVPLLETPGTSVRETAEVIYHLPHGIGSIAGHYDAMSIEDNTHYFTPGVFDFLESRGFPDHLGAFDDGTADGVAAETMRRTREFRLEFQKQAFDTKWARGTWGAGYRNLSHARTLGLTYYAIVPNLPPLIPPTATLDDFFRLQPIPDFVGQTSNFSGGGVGASFNVEFPLHPRVSIVSGISIGLYRGKSQSSFSSISSYYAFTYASGTPLTKDELFSLLSNPPPVDPNANPPTPAIADVSQFAVQTRLNTLSTSMFAQSYDLFVGLQVTVYKGLRVFGTLRDVYYANVGEYVVPTNGFTSDHRPLNAGYEGYVLGLSWRY
jgi:hypothetical protein